MARFILHLPTRSRDHDSVDCRFRESDLFITCKIMSGTLIKGQELLSLPSNTTLQAIQIIVDEQELETAVAGDIVQIRARCAEDDPVRAGSVLCAVEGKPCPTVRSFEAKLNVIACKNIVCAGYPCVLHIHNALVECTWEKVVSVLDRKTGQQIPGSRQPFVRVGQQAVVRIELADPVCLEAYKDLPALGRFIMREEGLTVAVGVVTELENL